MLLTILVQSLAVVKFAQPLVVGMLSAGHLAILLGGSLLVERSRVGQFTTQVGLGVGGGDAGCTEIVIWLSHHGPVQSVSMQNGPVQPPGLQLSEIVLTQLPPLLQFEPQHPPLLVHLGPEHRPPWTQLSPEQLLPSSQFSPKNSPCSRRRVYSRHRCNLVPLCSHRLYSPLSLVLVLQ